LAKEIRFQLKANETIKKEFRIGNKWIFTFSALEERFLKGH
jgi:hypothetical protein